MSPNQLRRRSCAALAAAAISACSSGGGGAEGDGIVRVAVRPPLVNVEVGGEIAFGAAVSGTADVTVTWSVLGADCGLVTQGGRYTAPALSGTCQVRATANADNTRSATALVTVTAGATGGGTDYRVGPVAGGCPVGDVCYDTLNDVRWSSLVPGDTVYIHYRPEPYRERFNVSGQGTPSQWIRVIGVPGPNGELPVISGNGATTAQHSDFYWTDASGPNTIQDSGVVFISPAQGDTATPKYIEIANLHIEGCYYPYQFTGENGVTASYASFCGAIYARSPQHLVIRNCVLTDSGLGFFNWTGPDLDTAYGGVAHDITLRGNYIYNNGISGHWGRHQTYTEALGVVYENNHFGPQRAGSLGSQLKDRSAGTVIRYNYIEASPGGWIMDLVEPEASFDILGADPTYGEDFVYGNVIVNKIYDASQGVNFIHWNEDNQVVTGRAEGGGRLYFYNNTILIEANAPVWGTPDLFNVNYGAGDCPPYEPTGRIDVRNNLVVRLPDTAGGTPASMNWGRCGQEHFDFGVNWVTSPGWALWEVAGSGTVTGQANIINAGLANPFVSVASNDYHLAAGSSPVGAAGALAPAVTSNTHGRDYTPHSQYLEPQMTEPRAGSGPGSDLGAFER